MKPDTEELSHGGSVQAAIQAGMEIAEPLEVIEGIFVHHKDFKFEDKREEAIALKRAIEKGPENPSSNILCHRPESFVAVYGDYAEARTKVYADSEQKRVVALFDYIEPKNESRGWGQFSATIIFQLSRKLREWRGMLEWQSQEAFANFLEDHLEDVVEPTGQDLLALATDLEANKEGHFKGKLNLDNGSVKLSYQDEVQTDVEVPRHLTLGIPLFEHGDLFKLKCRLRFNVTSGGVRFKILFTNLEDSISEHFEEIVQGLEESTKATIIRGNISVDH